ncbi:MAG TPA: Ala-tRNA(Pro) hydrolase [Acidimicrobiaceae bacterium]|nr:Ala-tRNA(Pro) hydrolase [Acidimicrobiaceae bacterium]HCB36735.1 Ala-tRNA(Pro) hydrolase [Acidimicrobiaceae bacterium]
MPQRPSSVCAVNDAAPSGGAPLGRAPLDGVTEMLYLDDAYAASMDAHVVAVRADDGAVALDRTVFYATGGGQPHDTGTLRVDGADGAGGPEFAVTDVRKHGELLWHTLAPAGGSGDGSGDPVGPAVGDAVVGTVDWPRRHALMRTHTSLHILCGVIWNEWGVSVTGGNMEPLSARMDFEFGPLPENFAAHVTELVNDEIAADRPIEISYLDRDVAVVDDDLIRTKVNLIPEFVKRVRVVDIVGLDKQADGGTHVASTSEVGRFEITKTESKGKGNKRVRLVIHD